jgi:aryl-alcohol dehydrogenase-like predicted oxidoreductase
VGEALEPVRDRVVIATKFGFPDGRPTSGLDSPSASRGGRGVAEAIDTSLADVRVEGERYPAQMKALTGR